MSIELLDIHKHFGAVRANNGIDLTLRPGTIHGILGENGAGKSTLMKILAGFIAKTSGRIFMDGREVDFATPAQASALGIGMLYQDPLDFPPLTVLENFMAGQASAGTQDRRTHRARLEGLCADLGFDLDPDVPAGRLTVGERQQLELVRLLASGTRVLILDEPTTGISALQKDLLFSGLKRLAREGRSVILVSHKLEDIEALCDEITVLREGMVSDTMDPLRNRGAPRHDVRRRAGACHPLGARTRGPDPAPRRRDGDGGRTGLKECTVNVSRGEVVGLAGLEGSGQDVFLRISAGLVRPARGRVHICRKDMTGRDYHAFRALGVAFQPASRLEEGLIRGLTVTEHCALEAGGGTFGVQWDAAELKAHDRIRAFQVTGTPGSTVESLSGGNQQRLLLSFLPDEPELLLLENPTRGLDMESVHWVWQYLDAHASRGTAIVFSSSELDEILMVADRVLVFFDGRIIADERPEDTDALELGRAIAGKV